MTKNYVLSEMLAFAESLKIQEMKLIFADHYDYMGITK